MKIDILKTHGSGNEIFLVDGRPSALLGSPAAVVEFVRAICDRAGPLGADGVYFVDDSVGVVEAFFYNPDGSAARLCGNGLRCVGRLVMERRGASSAAVAIGDSVFDVRSAGEFAPGVSGVAVTLPPVSFAAGDVPMKWPAPECVDSPIPELASAARFSGVAVPNSHLVAVVDSYDEHELVDVAGRVRENAGLLPEGANVSFVQPLAGGDVFVRTSERGVGLTLSCGSGVAASRAVLSRLGLAPAQARVVMRNPGGDSVCRLTGGDGAWVPRHEGNATFVYRAGLDVDLDSLRAGEARIEAHVDAAEFADEALAYAAQRDENLRVLREHGVATPAGSADDRV
jgi:diaminopimelate epimerase